MFREILFLDPPRIAELRRIAASAPFVDGRITNPHSTVKNNLQLHDQQAYTRSAEILARAMMGNDEFRNFAVPAAIAPPLMTRYQPGMHYGAHSDAAILTVAAVGTLRSDLSCTIFLNDPEDYEGGALRMQLGSAELRFKLPAGHGIVYPSTTLHEVEPVSRGERLVAISFVQSRIKDAHQREMLYELGEVAALEGLRMERDNFVRLQLVQQNLLRHWAEKP
jgi:PKHD-type hydroxylase